MYPIMRSLVGALLWSHVALTVSAFQSTPSRSSASWHRPQNVPLAAQPTPSSAIPSIRSSRTSTGLYQISTTLSSTSVDTALLEDTVTHHNLPTHADALLGAAWDRLVATTAVTRSKLSRLQQKVASSGVATALSYSLVSNAFTSVAVSLAWYGFSCQTGLSPLSPGQWKPFLGLYAGFYAVNSLLKPVRFVVALSVVAPRTEQLLQSLEESTESRKTAVGCGVALLATTSAIMMATGIGLASVSSGVPLLS